MPEKTKTIEVYLTQKPETPAGPEKASRDMDATNAEPEVGGRGYYRWVECWHCHSMRRVYWENPGQSFICGSCGVEYVPND
jgi:hypothetical protein